MKYRGMDATLVMIHQSQFSSFFRAMSHMPVYAAAEAKPSASGTVLLLANLLRTGAPSSASSSCSSRGFCYIYPSQNSQASANVGGIASADSMCSTDGARPAAATFTIKAFLVGGATRRASQSANAGDGQIDWVLLDNEQYRQAKGDTVIGINGANKLFTFPLTAASGFVDSGIAFKTGLTARWLSSGNDWGPCANTVGHQDLGTGNANNPAAIAGGNIACANPGYYLLCVEQ